MKGIVSAPWIVPVPLCVARLPQLCANDGKDGLMWMTRWQAWRPAVSALLAAVAIVVTATLAGVYLADAFDSYASVAQPGAREPGEIEALSARRLGAYFAGFQIALIALTVLAARSFTPGIAGTLGLRQPARGARTYILAIAGVIALASIAGGLFYVLDKASFINDLRPFAGLARSDGWWILLLAAGLGAPIAEELLFRGLLYTGIRTSPVGASGAAVVTSLLWASLHTEYSGYGLALLVLFGLYFAWLREKTGSVWPAILAHGIYNSLVVLALARLPEHLLP